MLIKRVRLTFAEPRLQPRSLIFRASRIRMDSGFPIAHSGLLWNGARGAKYRADANDNSKSSPSFPAEGRPTGKLRPPPLHVGYALTITSGSSNAAQFDETSGYLKSIRSGAEPRTA